MEKWIIEVNNADDLYNAIHAEWLRNTQLYNPEDLTIQTVDSVSEALQIYEEFRHVLVIIYANNSNYIEYLERLNKNTDVPIVVVEPTTDNFNDALSKGATLYEVYGEIPERRECSIVLASKALIRRYLFDKYDVPYFGEEGDYAATLTKENLSEALVTMNSMISKSEKAREKFEFGTSHHTLQTNRIKALQIASALMTKELSGSRTIESYTKNDIQKALNPISSLISKSEKAQTKLEKGTWQHSMLANNLDALYIAFGLVAIRIKTDKE